MLLIRSNFILKHIRFRHYSSDNKWDVLFFGTDNFSLYSLESVYKKYVSGSVINKLEVVTNLKSRKNEVHKFSEHCNLNTHQWPLQLTPENKFHVGIVVSFGHLIPESVIKLFPLGILNVHASLLPKWRGAAPIIHSLLNGDTKTGVTIMRIQPKHFDTGDVLLQREVAIGEDTLQTELHHTLATLGAEALMDCLDTLPDCLHNAKSQNSNDATYAPRISKHLGVIKWKEKTAQEIYNLSRALHGVYPLQTSFHSLHVKLHDVALWKDDSDDISQRLDKKLPGHFKYIKTKNVIRVWCSDGNSVYFKSISLPGKKIMSAVDFRNGFLKNTSDKDMYFTSNNLCLENEIIKSRI